ncbi:MAG: filamentous hemagglutinin N-terminal domain-containing protein [Microcoleaceae cyanobacterium]
MKLYVSSFLSIFSLTAALLMSKSVRVVAQIVPDNSLGTENSVVVPNVDILGSDGNSINSDRIDGGAIRGSNLFHSFQEFNINQGGGAYFSNPEGISNILSRVTGGNLSNISGILGVLGNANLFLINPNGIVFGPNARLDVNGSFFASSADGLLFENGIEFAASNPEAPPLLTINIPLGLNFRENPGSLTVQGSGLTQARFGFVGVIQAVLDENRGLSVPVGETLGLIGGDVAINGGLIKVESGRIELGAVGSNSLVNFIPTETGLSLEYDSTQNFQQLTFNGRAGIIASGVGGGGEIQIIGQQFTASEGTEIQSFNLDADPGGEINIKAAEINFSGTDPNTSAPTRVVTGTFGAGNSGNILVEATERLTIEDGAGIASDTSGTGSGGVVTVISPEVTVQGTTPSEVSPSAIVSVTFGPGDAGSVIIQTDRLNIQNGAAIGGFINPVDSGETGNVASVNIQATESVEISGVSASGNFPSNISAGTASSGNAGDIQIDTNQLRIEAGGNVSAATVSNGNAGNISINASELILLDNAETPLNSNFLTLISAATAGSGTAGTVTLNTGQLLIRNGAAVTTGTIGNGNAGNININATDLVELSGVTPENLISNISAGTTDDGNAGTINISTRDLRIQDNSLLRAFTRGTGDAGNINILATGVVELIGDQLNPNGINGITAVTTQTGNAGNININAARLIIRDGASLSVGTLGSGNAGTVDVVVSDTVEITGISSEGAIPSQVNATTFGTGNAGTVTITTDNLVLQDGGRIEVETEDAGNAGQIAIAADSISLTGINNQFSSQLRASTSGSGNAGNITVQAQNLTASDGAEIIASTTDAGNAGTINLTISDIELTGNRPSLITAETEATGNAGNIIITANQFTTTASSGIEASSTGTGDGGNIQVNASELVLLQNSGFLTALTEQTGDAGDVTVATENLILQNQGEINVQSFSTGIPGNINVEASNLQLNNQSILNANSAAGVGGSINLKASDIRLFNNSSILATGSDSGQTLEGNIRIDADLLVLLQGSQIVTDASNPTGGSNINIQPLNDDSIVIVQSNDSQIIAAGNLSIDSSVTFKPTEVPEVAVVDPNDLIAAEFCRQRGESEFTILGRGGIALNPNDKGTANQINVDLVEPVPTQQQNLSQQPSPTNTNQPISSLDILPARGWIRNQNGDVILVSYDPTTIGSQRLPIPSYQCQPGVAD